MSIDDPEVRDAHPDARSEPLDLQRVYADPLRLRLLDERCEMLRELLSRHV